MKRSKTSTRRRKGGNKGAKMRLMDKIAVWLFLAMLLFFIVPWQRPL